MNWQKDLKTKRKRVTRGKILLVFIGSLAIIAIFKRINLTNLKSLLSFSPIFLFTSQKMLTPLGNSQKEDLILWQLQNQNLAPIKVFLREKNILGVLLSSEIEVFFSLEKDVGEQITSLQMIISRFKIEGKQPKKIDLRFEKPVISF